MKTIKANCVGDVPKDFTGKVEYSWGMVVWYKNGKQHRDKGPATILENGSKGWFKNDKLHRIDGPAVELSSGHKHWLQNNKRHRTDGPAIEYGDGRVEYWINGEEITELAMKLYAIAFPNEIDQE
jgi:hypothetical protein